MIMTNLNRELEPNRAFYGEVVTSIYSPFCVSKSSPLRDSLSPAMSWLQATGTESV